MKGLLRKDMYITLSTCRAYIFIVIVYAFILALKQTVKPDSVLAASLGMQLFTGYFAGLIPVTVVSVDESSGWNTYSLTLPYSRRDVVAAKYVFALLTALFTGVLTVIAISVGMMIGGRFDLPDLLIRTGSVCAVSLMPSAFSLPFMYKLGAERGRYAFMIIMVFLTVGGVSLFSTGMIFDPGADVESAVTPGDMSVLTAALIGAALLLFGLSYLLCVRLYSKRDL